MNISTRPDGGVVRLAVTGELDMATADELGNAISDTSQSPHGVGAPSCCGATPRTTPAVALIALSSTA